MSEKNNNYLALASDIFNFFNGMASGHGGFLMRTMLGNLRTQPERLNLMSLVAFNLVENGYLTVDENGFYKLTDMGFDYIQGEDTIIDNRIDLTHYVDLTKDRLSIFNALWRIIGKKESAPFYVNGPAFFEAANAFLNVSTDYNSYIDELRNKEKSTSRISWYRELFIKLKVDDVMPFLYRLSESIEHEFGVVSATKLNDVDCQILNLESIKMTGENQPDKSQPNPAPRKKKIMISYCQEDEVHNAWVRKLHDNLTQADFDVLLDQEIRYGEDINTFMEKSVRESDRVLLILTPEYKRRADDRVKGVGYETTIITAELYNNQDNIKFFPVIRKGTKDDCFPSYLGNRKGLPMTDKDDYATALTLMIADLKKD